LIPQSESTKPTLRALSPQQVAARYGIAAIKVRRWIETGELGAVNVATRLGGKKPRWRVPAEALAEFERRRSSSATATRPPARRSRKTARVFEYF